MFHNLDVSQTLQLLNHWAASLPQRDVSFQVHYWGLVPSHRNNQMHRHSFFEICYVLDGEGVYEENGTEYPLRREMFFLSRPGIWHQIRSGAGLDLAFVAFVVDESNSESEAVRRYRSLYETNRIIADNSTPVPASLLWKSLILQFHSPRTLTEHAVRSAAHALLASFYSLFTDRNETMPVLPANNSSMQLLHRAILYIRDNLSDPLYLDAVADYLHVSGRHLSRLFVDMTQLSFIEYVRQERIDFAKSRLKYTGLPIKTISAQAGFGSIHYFTRVFTQSTGLSPGVYRSRFAESGGASGKPHV